MSSSYDRTVRFARERGGRRPAAAIALALAVLWMIATLYEVVAHEHLGWYRDASEFVSLSASGIIFLTAIVWLYEAATSRD